MFDPKDLWFTCNICNVNYEKNPFGCTDKCFGCFLTEWIEETHQELLSASDDETIDQLQAYIKRLTTWQAAENQRAIAQASASATNTKATQGS